MKKILILSMIFLLLPVLLFGDLFPLETIFIMTPKILFAMIERILNIEFEEAVIQEQETFEDGTTFLLSYQMEEIIVVCTMIVYKGWKLYKIHPCLTNTPASFRFTLSSLTVLEMILLDHQFKETFSSSELLSDGQWVFEKHWYSRKSRTEVILILKAPLENEWIIRETVK